MKKRLALLLVSVMVIGLVGCGSGKDDKEKDGSSEISSSEVSSEADKEEVSESAKTILDNIWNKHSNDEKFSIGGGDPAKEISGEAGEVSVTETDLMNSYFSFPAEAASLIDDAAMYYFAMNANGFTAAAVHVKHSEQVETLARTMQQAINDRQWLCGFPDKYAIYSVGDTLIITFGYQDFMDVFKDKTVEAYPQAKVLYEENI